ncbi:hypothetical protein NO1_1160 [Candidatus Termititenax aidoneus]|uniref:Uncharacterized protein n=1 Tax=Termititenax aidoneus TaxID=2218524 RepID=A0A388TC47_TERA1|nr:hypothetical protein NO1_1160 [Candidatus Termititenax aidoneus]
MCAFLFAAPETNNLVFSQAFKTYSGALAAESFSPFAVELRSEYDYHITAGWKALAGCSLELGRTVGLLADVGAKKYLNDVFYVGTVYTFPLSFAQETLSSTSSGYDKDKYILTGYKPNLAFFAGMEIADDWVFEVKYRTVTHEVKHESEFRFWFASSSTKLSSLEEEKAAELSFSLGLIF